MKDQQINSFGKGMSKDVGHTVPQEGYYIDAENIRIITDGDSNRSAIVSSVVGNQKRLDLIHMDTYEDWTTVGSGPFEMLIVDLIFVPSKFIT